MARRFCCAPPHQCQISMPCQGVVRKVLLQVMQGSEAAESSPAPRSERKHYAGQRAGVCTARKWACFTGFVYCGANKTNVMTNLPLFRSALQA
eukprot:6181886-Pleurochrysis_carterae.AAC.3